MNRSEWQKVAIVNAGDNVGVALAHFFLAQGAAVLAADDEKGLAGMPAGVHTLALPADGERESLEAALRDGLAAWGRPELLINNFGRDFLTARMDEEDPEWETADDNRLRRSFAAIKVLLSWPNGHEEPLIVNVGTGRGLEPQGCIMHYTLLGLARSLSLAGETGVELANVCLHNPEGGRPECRVCAEEVMYLAPATSARRRQRVGELVLEAIRSYRPPK